MSLQGETPLGMMLDVVHALLDDGGIAVRVAGVTGLEVEEGGRVKGGG